MKLQSFQNAGFEFFLVFENGENFVANLEALIGKHVCRKNLSSARINFDWGCLEFCDGAVDIDPKTLYQFAMDNNQTSSLPVY